MSSIKSGNNNSQFNTGDTYKTVLPFIADFLPPNVSSLSTSNFKPFVEAYYKWLELGNNPLDIIFSFDKIIDYSKSANIEPYGNLFRSESAPLLPAGPVSNKVLLDTIVDQYLRKGTQDSLDYFFRTSYGTAPNITYAQNRLLYTSAAKKNYDYVIRIIPAEGVLQDSFVGQHMIGLTSNSGIDIVNVNQIRINGNNYLECKVTNTYGSLAAVQVVEGGTGYNNIPLIEIKGDGTGATATASVSGGKITSITVTSVGIGYTYASVYITPTGGDSPTTVATANAVLRGGFIGGEDIVSQTNPSIKGTIESLVAGFIIDAPGTDYVVGETLSYIISGNGFGVQAKVGTVKGGIDSITIVDGGAGYTSIPDVLIDGDGSGATAHAIISNGIVTNIVVDTPGTNYTYANVYVTAEIGTIPENYADAIANIKGGIVSIDLIDPGIEYSPYAIDESMFSDVVGPGVLDNGNISTYDLYYFNGSIPEVDVSALSGTGAQITVSLGCTAYVLNTLQPRFRGQFTDQLQQKYNVLFSLGTIDISSSSPNYTIGETVNQTDPVTGNVLWNAVVESWDSYKKTLIVSQFNVDAFNKSYSITGETSDAKRYLSGHYNHPLIIDRGDGIINREYTYYIRSAITPSNYDYYLRQNVHPAGLRYIAIVAQDAIEANKVGTYIFDVGPTGNIHLDSNIDAVFAYTTTPTPQYAPLFRLVEIESTTQVVNPSIGKFAHLPLYELGYNGLSTYEISSVTGEYLHGEKITSSSGGIGYVAAWINDKLLVSTISGTFSVSDTITGIDSGVTGALIALESENNTNSFITKFLNRTIYTGIGPTPMDYSRYSDQQRDLDSLLNGVI